MSTLTIRMESARLCADRLYKDPARAEFRVERSKPTSDPDGVSGARAALVLVAVYNAKGHRAEPRVVTLHQRVHWSRELARHADALARESQTDMSDDLASFTVQLT